MKSMARWSPLSGVVFVALWVVAFAITSGSPQSSDSDTKIVDYYNSSGHRTRDIVGIFCVLAGALFFIWFLSALRSRLARAEGRAGGLTAAAFGAGLVYASLSFTAVALFVSPSLTRSDTDKFQLDPNTFRLVNDLGYSIWVGGTTVALVTVVVTALLSLRAGLLPKWLAWLSFAVAATMLVSFLFIPMLIWLGWVLVVSIVLVWKHDASADTPSTMTT
jgi:hypothetical protein